ncbi:hypothetical protein, partial [Mycolicibacter sinensis]
TIATVVTTTGNRIGTRRPIRSGTADTTGTRVTTGATGTAITGIRTTGATSATGATVTTGQTRGALTIDIRGAGQANR